MKPDRKRERKAKAAFSMIEMLVVIALIGIVTAIAIVNIARINAEAEVSKNLRNAQQLATVCESARAVGLDFVAGTLGATVDALVVGATADASSPFAGVFFGVPGLSASDKNGASHYLDIVDGALIYLAP